MNAHQTSNPSQIDGPKNQLKKRVKWNPYKWPENINGCVTGVKKKLLVKGPGRTPRMTGVWAHVVHWVINDQYRLIQAGFHDQI